MFGRHPGGVGLETKKPTNINTMDYLVLELGAKIAEYKKLIEGNKGYVKMDFEKGVLEGLEIVRRILDNRP